ncbi:hypothetical protein TNCV_1019141 [Trichonephila clavipes]|nr:hypothetical protein TNCV_1019141 [Trichonephila clavipes]
MKFAANNPRVASVCVMQAKLKSNRIKLKKNQQHVNLSVLPYGGHGSLWSRSRSRGRYVMSSSLVPLKTRRAEGSMHVEYVKAPPVGVVWKLGEEVPARVSLDYDSTLRGS